MPADLRGADLRSANLKRATLSGADLRGADLRSADLRFANLCGADLRGANLERARLQGADFFHERRCTEAGARLEYADLRGAMLLGATLNGAKLIGALLHGADLTYARLNFADLSDAHLEGAFLGEADSVGTQFTGANLRFAVMPMTILGVELGNRASLRGAELSANFWGVDVSSADFELTNLTGSRCDYEYPVTLGAELKKEGLDEDAMEKIQSRLKRLELEPPDHDAQRAECARNICKSAGRGRWTGCGSVGDRGEEQYYDDLMTLMEIDLCKDPYITLGLLRRAANNENLRRRFINFFARTRTCLFPDRQMWAPKLVQELTEYMRAFGIKG